MDPYLEMSWHDVHHRLCNYSCDRIQTQLGPRLARLDERLIVESSLDHDRDIYPDVRVFEHPRESSAPAVAYAGVAVAEPDVEIELRHEESRQAFIEIRDITKDGKVVTVIEFVSPTNKLTRDGKRKYRQKQRECIQGNISLVEIDLTRAGPRRLLAADAQVPAKHRKTYQVCVFRGYRRSKLALYGISLRDRLPAIRIPLRRNDPDAVLDLQAVVDEAYEKGRYDDIDYSQPPVPPLTGEDAAWAAELLKSAGRA